MENLSEDPLVLEWDSDSDLSTGSMMVILMALQTAHHPALGTGLMLGMEWKLSSKGLQ